MAIPSATREETVRIAASPTAPLTAFLFTKQHAKRGVDPQAFFALMRMETSPVRKTTIAQKITTMDKPELYSLTHVIHTLTMAIALTMQERTHVSKTRMKNSATKTT